MRLLCRSAYLPPLASAKRSVNNRHGKPAAPALREYLSSAATLNGAQAARIFGGTRSGGITTACTRPRTRRLLSSVIARARRVMPGVGQLCVIDRCLRKCCRTRSSSAAANLRPSSLSGGSTAPQGRHISCSCRTYYDSRSTARYHLVYKHST
jgi:hypothetical protein